MNIKLAEALLRRKELQDKVKQLQPINVRDLFEIKFQRKQVSEQVDDLQASVPKVSITEVTAAYDYYSRALRQIDSVIQQANWTTELQIEENVMKDFTKQV